MGIWDYISSAANAVNQNAVIRGRNLCSSCGQAATAKIDNAISAVPNHFHNDNVAQFATGFAKNAATFVLREGLKAIPGAKPIYDIATRSIPNNSKSEKNKQLELKEISSALEDQGRQIEEMNDLIEKMKEEISWLKEVVDQVHEHDRDTKLKSKL